MPLEAELYSSNALPRFEWKIENFLKEADIRIQHAVAMEDAHCEQRLKQQQSDLCNWLEKLDTLGADCASKADIYSLGVVFLEVCRQLVLSVSV